MLPRRGYEPVDDLDEDSAPDLQAGAASERDDDHHVPGEQSALYSSVPAVAAAGGKAGNSSDGVNSRTTAGAREVRSDDEDDDGRMTVRVLDVRGQFYPLRVTPETSVRELKLMLVDAAGVEVPRQRIIHGGKMLSDADTLGGRKISDGAAIHLFQRPKVAAAAAAGVGTASAQQPGNLHEFPPVLLQVQERGGNGEGAGAHWEVEAPRRNIMFLASILVLISVLQLLECLASISTVLSVPGGGSTGGGNGGSAHPSLPGEYWFLVKGRTLSSVMGIVVGTLGVRGSQSLNTHTIRWYFVGLVMCAIVAMAIRIEVFFDIVTGKIPFGDYGINSTDSSREDDPGEGGGGGGGGGSGTGDEGGPGAHHETAEEAQSSLFFMAFSAFVSVVVSGALWMLCIRRVNDMRGVISIHVANWERQERGEGLEGRTGGGLMNAISDPELEGSRRNIASV